MCLRQVCLARQRVCKNSAGALRVPPLGPLGGGRPSTRLCDPPSGLSYFQQLEQKVSQFALLISLGWDAQVRCVGLGFAVPTSSLPRFGARATSFGTSGDPAKANLKMIDELLKTLICFVRVLSLFFLPRFVFCCTLQVGQVLPQGMELNRHTDFFFFFFKIYRKTAALSHPSEYTHKYECMYICTYIYVPLTINYIYPESLYFVKMTTCHLDVPTLLNDASSPHALKKSAAR